MARTIRSAASSGDSVGTFWYSFVGAIIGVRTSGMLIVVNLMPTSANSDDAQAVHASSAAFEATYAEKRGALVSTPIDEMLITCPRRLADMWGIRPIVIRS